MANPRRKRVRAIPRAPDGSAFHKCSDCGALVPIVLDDMHECRVNKAVKRFWGKCEKSTVSNLRLEEEPRSGFRMYMGNLRESLPDEDPAVIDRKGFDIWKTMSAQERDSYERAAKRIDSAYLGKWIAEIHSTSHYQMDDEADSAMVGKFDQFVNSEDLEVYSDSTNS
ncbi:hypothetical protein QQ045_004728 [Rhodiola kirilowii]